MRHVSKKLVLLASMLGLVTVGCSTQPRRLPMVSASAMQAADRTERLLTEAERCEREGQPRLAMKLYEYMSTQGLGTDDTRARYELLAARFDVPESHDRTRRPTLAPVSGYAALEGPQLDEQSVVLEASVIEESPVAEDVGVSEVLSVSAELADETPAVDNASAVAGNSALAPREGPLLARKDTATEDRTPGVWEVYVTPSDELVESSGLVEPLPEIAYSPPGAASEEGDTTSITETAIDFPEVSLGETGWVGMADSESEPHDDDGWSPATSHETELTSDGWEPAAEDRGAVELASHDGGEVTLDAALEQADSAVPEPASEDGPQLRPAGVVVLASDIENQERAEAAQALCEVEGDIDSALDRLAEMLHADDESARLAAYLLGGLGEEAAPVVDDLVALRDAKDGVTSLHAAESLTHVNPEDASSFERIVAGLESENSRVRWFATVSLGSVSERYRSDAAEALQIALQDDDCSVRVAAVLSLGGLGDHAEIALTALEQATEDGTPSVRDAAHAALECLKR